MARHIRVPQGQAESRLVAGKASVATEDSNFRRVFLDIEGARGYLEDEVGIYVPGEDEWPDLYAIVPILVGRGPGGEQVLNPPWTVRRSLDDLSASTRRNYLASRQARKEAEMHGMSVEQWYRVAPDLKAFRRKAKARQHDRGLHVEYGVWIARDTQPLTAQEKYDLGQHIREIQGGAA